MTTALAALSRRCAPAMRRAVRASTASGAAVPSAGGGANGSTNAYSAALLCGVRDRPLVPCALAGLTPLHARWFSSAKSKWGVVNGDIKAHVVQLVGDDGKITPNVPVNQALAEAKKRGVDLVQVSSNGDQVVCRMFDAKKRLFSMKKAAKPQKPKQDKEVVFGVKIEGHDIKVKVEQVKKFLSKGHKVKVAVKFAQQYHLKTKSLEQIKLIEESISADVGVADQAPREQFGGVENDLIAFGVCGPQWLAGVSRVCMELVVPAAAPQRGPGTIMYVTSLERFHYAMMHKYEHQVGQDLFAAFVASAERIGHVEKETTMLQVVQHLRKGLMTLE